MAAIKTHIKMADLHSGHFCVSYWSAFSLWQTGYITGLIQNIILSLLSNNYTDLSVMVFDLLQPSKTSAEMEAFLRFLADEKKEKGGTKENPAGFTCTIRV